MEVVTGPDLVEAGGRKVVMTGQRVGSDPQMLFRFEAGGRFEIVGLEGWAYDEEATKTQTFSSPLWGR